MVMSLRSKWAAGKAVRAGLAVGGRISKLIRNRRATQPPAHFQRNPLGRGQLRRHHHYMLDGALAGGEGFNRWTTKSRKSLIEY